MGSAGRSGSPGRTSTGPAAAARPRFPAAGDRGGAPTPAGAAPSVFPTAACPEPPPPAAGRPSLTLGIPRASPPVPRRADEGTQGFTLSLSLSQPLTPKTLPPPAPEPLPKGRVGLPRLARRQLPLPTLCRGRRCGQGPAYGSPSPLRRLPLTSRPPARPSVRPSVPSQAMSTTRRRGGSTTEAPRPAGCSARSFPSGDGAAHRSIVLLPDPRIPLLPTGRGERGGPGGTRKKTGRGGRTTASQSLLAFAAFPESRPRGQTAAHSGRLPAALPSWLGAAYASPPAPLPVPHLPGLLRPAASPAVSLAPNSPLVALPHVTSPKNPAEAAKASLHTSSSSSSFHAGSHVSRTHEGEKKHQTQTVPTPGII